VGEFNPVEFIKKANLSIREKELILGANAKAMF
jgi:hypothetical protein